MATRPCTDPRAARAPHLRRRAPRRRGEVCFKDLRIDLRAHRVWRAGQEIALTPREYDLLEALMRSRGATLYRDALYERVWGEADDEASTRTLDIHIQRLRKKLGWKKEICTIYKIGYRLEKRL